MTDDIVARLRHAAECPSCGYTYHDDASTEAADEIERLRGAIVTTLEHFDNCCWWDVEATLDRALNPPKENPC